MIIAEIGNNHNGDMRLARWLIHSAKINGADIAKFQIYDVENIIPLTHRWYHSLKTTQLSYEQVRYLKKTCDIEGIEFLASVFDSERVKWTEELGMSRYKIASRSVYNIPLLNAIGRTGKDVILSLGKYHSLKVEDRPKINTNGKVYYLYCIAKYPTEPKDIDMKEFDFKKYDGFSDHTIGIEYAKKAIDRGAKIIEKHFTFDRNMIGPDHIGSMTPMELNLLCNYDKCK